MRISFERSGQNRPSRFASHPIGIRGAELLRLQLGQRILSNRLHIALAFRADRRCRRVRPFTADGPIGRRTRCSVRVHRESHPDLGFAVYRASRPANGKRRGVARPASSRLDLTRCAECVPRLTFPVHFEIRKSPHEGLNGLFAAEGVPNDEKQNCCADHCCQGDRSGARSASRLDDANRPPPRRRGTIRGLRRREHYSMGIGPVHQYRCELASE